MANEQGPIRVLSEGRFVAGGLRPHSQESFVEAARELTEIIDGFVKKHGIGVVVGFAAPMIENPRRVYQGAFVLCHPALTGAAYEKLYEAVQHTVMMNAVDQQKKN
jgi:hypothetical protein